MMEHMIVLMVVILQPITSMLIIKRLQEKPSSKAKIVTYLLTASLLTIITICVLLVRSPQHIFYFQFPFTWNGRIMLFIGGCLVFFFLTSILPLFLLKNKQFQRQIIQSFRERQFIFPETRIEKVIFASLMLVVVSCEEIIFRSFLVDYLHGLPWGLSITISIFVAGMIFGLVHFIQGSNGVIHATLTGFILSFLFVITGSLWTSILVHYLHNLKILWIGQIARNHEGVLIVHEPRV